MTPYALGTILFGLLAISLLAIVGVATSQPAILKIAALLAGMTYLHYFIGHGLQEGDFKGAMYEHLHAGMALVVLVGWVVAFTRRRRLRITWYMRSPMCGPTRRCSHHGQRASVQPAAMPSQVGQSRGDRPFRLELCEVGRRRRELSRPVETEGNHV